MAVTFGAPAPAAEEAAPITVEITWMHREGTRLTGLMVLGTLTPADEAAWEATGRADQWHITGGTRRTTLDAFNDYHGDDQHHLNRVTPDQAARAAADWLGFTDRPVTVKILDETR